MGEPERAEEQFHRCEEKAPDSFYPSVGRGYLNCCRRWYNEAIAEYELILAKRPRNFKVFKTLFELYGHTGEEEKARRALKDAFHLCPYVKNHAVLQAQIDNY